MLNDLASNKALRYAALAVLVLLALFLLVKTWDSAFGRSPSDPVHTITVEGTGTVAAVPDIAHVSFTVIESAGTVAAAQQQATDRTDATLAALEDAGVDDKDVKTLYYNVSPRYEYDRSCPPGAYCPEFVSGTPRIVGYDVSQSIEVKVRDTAKAGEILGLLGELGVQNISGPNFTVDDEDAVRAEARGEAIKEAQAKAKVLARQLGARLGKVVSFSENGGYYPMPYGKGGGVMTDAVAQSAPTLPTGENETNVTVMITYEIR
ncbi:MAG TPA: SIMPL domain-containing protein [Candidatus Paceibacterota bacterium]|nr:SIMPL domain-containing protein [Candidatus Paceibacterota bacterium]